MDAQLRNERLTHETDLDLLKEETSLELEVEMEERLQAFKTRKEEKSPRNWSANSTSAKRSCGQSGIDVRKRGKSVLKLKPNSGSTC